MKRLGYGLLLLAFSGCQGTHLTGLQGWNQPARVPPPATGSFQVPGTYSGATGVSSPDPTKSVSVQTVPPGSAPATNPLVDQVTAAQNQLKLATDNARTAVLQSTQQFQSQVEQASARVDRMGSGVVQASQILSDAAQSPLPPPPPVTTGVVPANATSGSIRDGVPSTVTDPNAQWRKPVPR